MVFQERIFSLLFLRVLFRVLTEERERKRRFEKKGCKLLFVVIDTTTPSTAITSGTYYFFSNRPTCVSVVHMNKGFSTVITLVSSASIFLNCFGGLNIRACEMES